MERRLEMSRLNFPELGSSLYHWGVPIGYQFDIHYTSIDFQGQDVLEITEDVAIHENETVSITINDLDDFGVNYTFTFGSYNSDEVSISLTKPGFEFVDLEEWEFPCLYPLIPIGNSTYFESLDTYYTEVGYAVSLANGALRVEGSFEGNSFISEWNSTTGVLVYYNYISPDVKLELVFGEGNYIPPTSTTETTGTTDITETTNTTSVNTNATTTTNVSSLPPGLTTSGFEVLFILPAILVIPLFRRRRN